jgi:hypothetical protein
MYHLDHLLQLPWAPQRRVPPTEATRRKSLYQDFFDCGESGHFKAQLGKKADPIAWDRAANYLIVKRMVQTLTQRPK